MSMRPASGTRPLRPPGIALALMLGCAPAASLSPQTPLDGLVHAQWGIKEGAPSDVWATVQTTDGWVWFGGSHGLARFDGVSFEHVETAPGTPDPSPAVSDLRALESGELVVGYHDGGAAILRGHTFTNYHEAQGLGPSTVFGIEQDTDGRLWLATRGGLERFDGRRWETVGADWNLTPGPVEDVSVDNQGRLWVATKHDLEYLEHGRTRFQHSQPVTAGTNFLRSRDSRLWNSAPDSLAMNPLQAAASAPMPSRNWQHSTVALFDRDGSLWSIEDDSLSRYALSRAEALPPRIPLGKSAAPHEGLKVPLVRTLMEDRSGNLWLPTMEDVRLLRDRRVTPVDSTQSGQPVPSLISNMLTADDGTVWMTSLMDMAGLDPADGVWKYDGHFTHVQPSDLPGASSVFKDAHGTLWVAGRTALWRLDQGHLVRDISLPIDSARNFVVAMADDPATGSLWISIRGVGLFLRHGNDWIRNGNIGALPQSDPKVMALAPDRTLWLGYADGRVLALAGGKLTQVPIDGAPVLGAISAIDAGHRVLVGGAHGLAVLIGARLEILHPEQTSAFDAITGILQAADGRVWLNDAMGAVSIAADGLVESRIASGTPVPAAALGVEDGYPGRGADVQQMGSTMTQARDGRIWVSGLRGVGWFYPSALPRDAAVPLLIRSISTDAGTAPLDALVHLKAGTSHLTIAYTALNFTHPDQQRFRYRLAGFDKDWTDAGNRREAYYTNLLPGHYRFEVKELHETGHWSEVPVALDFDIAPTFEQTKTFIAVCVLASGIAMLLLIRWRVALLTRRERIRLQERMDERIGERERIARELHDTLLQGTQGLILTVHSALTRARRGESIEQMLENALASADGVVVESRERIQDLRTATHQRGGLGEALEALGRELARDRDVRFDVAVSGAQRDLDTTVADEAFRIGREALSNAFRHAGARVIELRLVYDADQFRLRVRDDGCGIGAEDLAEGARPGHWGLPGMRERAQRIGATLEVQSRSGEGTQIELAIGTKTAYADPPASTWWPSRWWTGRRATRHLKE